MLEDASQNYECLSTFCWKYRPKDAILGVVVIVQFMCIAALFETSQMYLQLERERTQTQTVKTLFDKDCSLDSANTCLMTSPC